jgi:hypothetical protein
MRDDEPLLRVVRGAPTAEELAALVGVLFARGGAPPAPAPARSRWRDSDRPGATAGRLPAHRGPDAWRASTLPR